MRPAAGFAVAFETIFEKYRIYKTGRAAQTSYRQERENEKGGGKEVLWIFMNEKQKRTEKKRKK